MFTHLSRRETQLRTAARQGAGRLRRPRRGPGRGHLRPAGISCHRPGRLRLRDPAPGRPRRGRPGRGDPGGSRPRGHRRRHGGLADHLDRARCRPDRGHYGRPARPSAGRPPGRLRHHRMNAPAGPARNTSRARNPPQGPGADQGRAGQRHRRQPRPSSRRNAGRHSQADPGNRQRLPRAGPLRQPATRGTDLREVLAASSTARRTVRPQNRKSCYASVMRRRDRGNPVSMPGTLLGPSCVSACDVASDVTASARWLPRLAAHA